ncbi:MAG: ATP-binding protein [Anaerolineales bacterium]|nr:ATP-binding protein [Anaerolineales bacterium]
MNLHSTYRWKISEIPISMVVLVILLGFTVGIFARVPYTGLYFDPNSGVILDVYSPGGITLQPGDVLIKVGDVTFEDYKKSATLPLFTPDLRKGDVLLILVERNGEKIPVDWEIPGFDLVGFRGRLFNIFWFSYIYWFFGAFVEVFIRPRNVLWRLLIASNHLTGLWLMVGAISTWRVLGSSLLFHAFAWLILPVYLHLHWNFPQPLFRLPRISSIILYSFAGLMTVGELIQLLPRNLFYLAIILALGGSFILLLLHFILRPAQRRQIGLLALSTFLAVLPLIFVGVTGLFDLVPASAPLALIAFILMPAAYLYLIFRAQLGGMEARANRFISIFAFLILLGTILVIFAHVEVFLPREISALLAIILPLVASAFSISRFPRFEAFIEKNIFGIKLPHRHLLETFSSRISVSDSFPSLLAMLENEVFPSLLVRQYAFLHAREKTLGVLFAKEVPNEPFDFDVLTQKAGRYIPNLPPDEGWLRLILPLKVGDKILGFWLLGRRDPDDLYPQVEIPILQSLADQTAIALSNILQSDLLRNFYQSEFESIESERTRISRDLHDKVLGKLANIHNKLDPKNLPPSFQSDYEDIKKRLREIINNLRPPMLDHGFTYAVEEMVENLKEKHADVNIALDLRSSEERLPEKMEEHLFHIVHEACENALKHSECRALTISGSVSPERVDLSIQDDGRGFDSNTNLNDLIAKRHFGLANMKDRAHVIGAELEIRSRPGHGAAIHITWKPKLKNLLRNLPK